jgi:hypothetical protein
MITLKNPVDESVFQVVEEDERDKLFPNGMNWFNAPAYIHANKKDEWRLPTVAELELMYNELYLKGLGNFQKANYWSSEPQSATFAYYFSFELGRSAYWGKTGYMKIRLVKTISAGNAKVVKPQKSSQKQCFVITATMQDPKHPIVEEFRMFRDTYLNTNALGRKAVRLYYVLGPFLAAIIDQNKVLRKLSFNLFVNPIYKLIRRF